MRHRVKIAVLVLIINSVSSVQASSQAILRAVKKARATLDFIAAQLEKNPRVQLGVLLTTLTAAELALNRALKDHRNSVANSSRRSVAE